MRSRALLLVLMVGLGACDSEEVTGRCDGRPCRDASFDSASDGADGAAMDSWMPIDVGDPTEYQLASVQIMPRDVTVTTPAGTRAMQTFTVVGTRRNGTMTAPLRGLWSLGSNVLGQIDPATGEFTATGEVGGTDRVRVVVAADGGELRDETGITVELRREIIATGAPADAAMRFSMPATLDAMRGPNIVYPLAGAVMPQNVYPADIQWLNGAAGDVFRIRMRKSHIDVVAYVMHTGAGFRNDWLPEAAAWRALAQTDVDESANITIDRWIAPMGPVVTSSSVSIRFANGAVSGSIYYWDIAAGRAIRIDDGTATRNSFMPTPPRALDDGSNCVGCHAVSRDGRYFAGRLGGGANNTGTVFDLTRDLTPNPAPSLFPVNTTSRWTFASFNPDNSRMVIDQGLALRLMNPLTGAMVPVAGGSLPATRSTQPTWSPDGRFIAYVANIDNSWGGEFRAGSIAVVPVAGVDTFGGASVLHTGSALAGDTPGGNADSYPSWTPDSRWLAFSHGDISRSDTGRGALYMISAAGSPPVRLNNACGGATTTDNFFPNISPFNSGGYFWMAFLSRRDYGNATAGTRGRSRQQIWIAAIRNMPAGGTDPTEVAYWMPGQDTASQNITAFWAPRPCRRDSEDCRVSSECCSGICRDNGMGRTVCTPPPMDMCRMRDQPCGGSGCCMGLVCINNVCSSPPG